MATFSRHSTQKAYSQRSIAADHGQKKRGVILILMKNKKSQERAMSIKFVGTQLEVVGAGVDWMGLVRRLNKKLGQAQLHSLVPVVVRDGDPHLPSTFTAADDGGCTVM